METHIAFLKGINVGGHKKVPMVKLKELLKKVGFQEVTTYIQSGNVVFKYQEKNIQIIEEVISTAILEYFGFEVSVLVKTRDDLKRIFEASPFSEEQTKVSYFIMLHKTPNEKSIGEATKKTYDGEQYKIIKDCIYFYCEKGYGQAKFNMNFFERTLNTFATARNYNTMLKLLSLSE